MVSAINWTIVSQLSRQQLQWSTVSLSRWPSNSVYSTMHMSQQSVHCTSLSAAVDTFFNRPYTQPTVSKHRWRGYQLCSVLLFSSPRSKGWPHHRRTFSIYLCPLSFWSTLPRGVLSTSWCCPSRPCAVFLDCMQLALFLALSLSPGNSLVTSVMVRTYSMLAFALTVSNSSLFTPPLLRS